MAHVNCPNCGSHLSVPEAEGQLRLRCPACKHTFAVASRGSKPVAPRPSSAPMQGYSEASLGTPVKVALIALALAGIGVLGFVAYSALWSESPEAAPQQAAAPEGRAQREPERTDAARHEDARPDQTATVRGSEEATGSQASGDKRAGHAAQPRPSLGDQVRARLAGEPLPAPASKMSPRELFKQCSPAVVRVVVRDKDFQPIGLGSGFFVSEDGLLVTNHHVIEGAEFASVLLDNNATLFVDGVLATDPERDLALLKVNGTGLPRLLLTGPMPETGTEVYAIGNPEGLTNTFSQGIISGVRELDEDVQVLQTTAAISHGSSGGPLLASDGNLVGVTSSFLAEGQSLNFAVPSADVRTLVASRGELRPLASAGGDRLGPDQTEDLDRAWDALAEEDWHAATDILVRLRREQPDNAAVWFALGYLHGEIGNHEAAIAAYKKAIALQPDNVGAYALLGVAYAGMERYDDAIAAFKKAIAIQPDNAQAHAALGAAYAGMERYDDAIAAANKALSIRPDHVGAHFVLGVAYANTERNPDAIAAFKKAIAIQPDHAAAHYHLGLAYGNMERYHDAIAAFRKATTLRPDDADAHFYLGLAYAAVERHHAAIAAFKNAIAMRPDDAGAHLHLGFAYVFVERYRDAIGAFKKAADLDPDGRTGRLARQALTTLRSK